MKKYIRLKDLSWEWITTFADYDRARNKATELGLTYSVEIVKQADTIEKLCDEFVTVNNADRLPFRLSVSVARELEDKDKTGKLYSGTCESLFELAKNKLENLKEFVGTKEKHDSLANYLYEQNPNFVFKGTIKGAIWTSKGLLYVAELNDKGELELL